MSTSRHLDKTCIGIVAIMLVITILFMNGKALGIQSASYDLGYESRIFDTSKVHQIDLVMDDWDTFIENCESEEYSVCTAVIDGEKYSNIGLRAKGNTSLSRVKSLDSQRYSFKLEFDQYEYGKNYHGLDKLCLNNIIQDNTMMKDYLAYRMMGAFGVNAPLCSFVYITVNGEDWGLYLAVEGVEDSFLNRNYGTDIGDLYKPDSMSFGGGRGNGRDFDMDEFRKEHLENSDEDSDETESSSGAEIAAETTGDTSGADPAGTGRSGTSGADSTGTGSGVTSGADTAGTGSGDTSGFGEGPMGAASGDMSGAGFTGRGPGDMSGAGFTGRGPGGMRGEGPMRGGHGQGGKGGGMGSMGSDDVKLKYIDDDPDSYSNIFESAKTDVTDADKTRLISSLKSLSEYTDLEEILDMEEVLRYFVVHNFVCNGDSYTGSMIHNYYLHEDSDGKLGMIPWDYNLAFGTFQGGNASDTVNTSIDSPVSGGDVDDRPMVGWIFSDEKYTEAYHELFSQFIEQWFTDGELVSLISETAEMIRPYVEKDPTKFCTLEEFDKGVEAISEFVSLRGEAVSRQLKGDTTAVDTGDLSLNDMGGMNSGSGEAGGDRSGGNRPGGRMGGQNSYGTAAETAANEQNTMAPPSGYSNSSDMPSGMPEGGMASPDSEEMTESPSPLKMAGLTGVSAIVLLAGILIAWKKK